MKYICYLFILFLIIIAVFPAYSQLTATDIEKIRSIVEKSETDMKAQIEKSEVNMKAAIEKSEKAMKEYIDLKIDGVNTKIDGVNNTLSAEIQGVRKSLNFLFGFVIALVGLIGVAIGLPTVMSLIRQKNQPIQEEPQKESNPT